MGNDQAVIDRIVNDVMTYVHTKAIELYKNNQTVKTSLFGKKEIIITTWNIDLYLGVGFS